MSDDARPIPESYPWHLYCPTCGWCGEECAAQRPDCQECGTPLRIEVAGDAFASAFRAIDDDRIVCPVRRRLP